MNARIFVAVAAAFLTGGCLSSVGPGLRLVTGTVHSRHGAPVDHARVWTQSGATAVSNARGRFRILVHLGSDTILYAADGCAPGRVYVETCGGSAVLGEARRSIDIVLTECTPI